jgi:hypothetical protein
MSSPNSPQSLSLGQFVARFGPEMIPLGNRFCYFCAAVSLSEDDLREYLEEPVAALPPRVAAALPKVQIILVPYLDKGGAKTRRGRPADLLITGERPVEERFSFSGSVVLDDEVLLAFAVKDTEVADYHYRFYRAIAELLVARVPEPEMGRYVGLLREELSAGIHGEVDEASWRAKQAISRRSAGRGESKRFREYGRASFVDTMTLYLHGLCCDIDVETGPRQLPSRFLRQRLELFKELYAPPQGYVVFPDENGA